MPTLTIPKKLTKGEDLVVIPRKEYEELLRVQQSMPEKVKTFKPTASEKKAIAEARKRFAKGEYLTLEELRHELALNR
ncbi:MAG: hypothetical protein G01um101429_82 [Parcubacteria group bacterium Gr01-1014_29]|nr:MAG: hypothetical protein G01um101429_82 [Parcubacteria group bacterium Gr01-1014_29]